MKKTFLKAAIPTLAMLLVAIMALTGTTYAWFKQNDTAQVGPINVTIAEAASLNIATVSSSANNKIGPWVSTLDSDDIKLGMGNQVNVDTDPASTVGGINPQFYTFTWDGNDKTSASGNGTPGTEFTLFLQNDGNTDKIITIGESSVTGDAAACVRVMFLSYAPDTYEGGTFTPGATATSSAVWCVNGDTTATGLKDNPGNGKTAGQVAAVEGPVTNVQSKENIKFTIPANKILRLKVCAWLEGEICDNGEAGKDYTFTLKLKSQDAAS